MEQRFGGDGLLELLNLAQTRVVFVERHLLDGVMGAWLRGLPLTVEMRRQIEDAALTQHGRMLVVPTRGRPLLTEIPRPGRDDARKGRR